MRGFTLVEMLVTVAIIAVLAALLLPTAKRVTDRAATSRSINNLRQIGIAVAGYVADSGGALPSKKFADTQQCWFYQVYERSYNKPCPDFIPWDTGENFRGTILFSPSLKSNEAKPWRSYGWNSIMQGDNEPPPRVASLAHPSQVILCGDSLNSSNVMYGSINYRNDGKALILMADFHVQSFRPQEIPANSDPMWRPLP